MNTAAKIIPFEEPGKPCPRCNDAPAKTMPNPLCEGAEWVFPCDACAEIIEAESQTKISAEVREERRAKYEAAIPPLFRENDTSLFPGIWATIKDWQPGNDGKGLILVGDTGTCKTRMVAQIAKRLIMRDGINCRLLRASNFAKIVRAQYSKASENEARREMRELETVRVLILDDIGKQATTEGIEEAVFELVEERITNKRPMIVTANATGKELEAMMSSDRGRPLVRRLREFCEPHAVKPTLSKKETVQ